MPLERRLGLIELSPRVFILNVGPGLLWYMPAKLVEILPKRSAVSTVTRCKALLRVAANFIMGSPYYGGLFIFN